MEIVNIQHSKTIYQFKIDEHELEGIAYMLSIASEKLKKDSLMHINIYHEGDRFVMGNNMESVLRTISDLSGTRI